MPLFQTLTKLGATLPALRNLAPGATARPLLGPLALLEPRTLHPTAPAEPGCQAVQYAAQLAAQFAAAPASKGVVWKSLLGTAADDADRLLNLRHFAVLGLQTKLRGLVQEDAGTSTLALRLFLSAQTDHAYVDTDTYQRMALDAVEVLGVPAEFPVFIDVRRECLVVDTMNFFEIGTACVTAAAVHGVAVLCESPRFLACLQEQPLALELIPAAQQASCRLLLQAAGRCVVRRVLDEPRLQMPPLAQQLAEQAGTAVVVRALLAGTAADTQAAAQVFARLWQDRRGAGQAAPAARQPA